MKLKLHFCLALFLALSLLSFAQVTDKLNYQAVARNSSGAILANQPIGLRLTIENGSSGPVLYQERQMPTTNQFGLLTVKIGNGTVLQGTWNSIVWSNGNQWLKVDMDPTGGNSYTAMGESELLSVPFANYSAVSGDNLWVVNGANIHNVNNGNVGIGMPVPMYKLHVDDNTTGGRAVYGENTSSASTNAIGVYGRSENAMNYGTGVYGLGGFAGVYGTTTGGTDYLTEYGVYGTAPGTAGTRIGLYGYANGTPSYNYGVYAYAQNATVKNYSGYFAGSPIAVTYPYTSYNEFENPYIYQSANGYPSLAFIANYLGSYRGAQLVLEATNGVMAVYDSVGTNYGQWNAAAYNVVSDRRLKNSITDISPAEYENYLTQIRSIESATYFYNNEVRDYKHIGFIAQSLPKEVLHIQTQTKQGPDNLLMYNLSDMTGLNTLGIKAIDSKEQLLEKRIAELEKEIENLKKK